MPRKPGEKLPTHSTELDGVTKAAVLLVSITPDAATKILKVMPAEQVEEVTREIASLGTVPPPLRSEIV
ncbi:MAG: hypothetical protein AAGD00_10625, partial [Planctomycetota bacterium]